LLASAGTTTGAEAGSTTPPWQPDNRQRIQAYLEDSLARPNALEANVGAAASGLMAVEFRLHQAIAAALPATPAALEHYPRLMPAIDGCLRINKQIDRLAQLQLQLAAAQQAAREVEPKRAALPGKSEDFAF
jgi:hypothetical protein